MAGQRKAEKRKRSGTESFVSSYVRRCQRCQVRPSVEILGLTPGPVLQFSTDRLAFRDWSPLLAAIAVDKTLSDIRIFSRKPLSKHLEDVKTEGGSRGVRRGVLTGWSLGGLSRAIASRLLTPGLTVLELDSIPLANKDARLLAEGLCKNSSMERLSLKHCPLGDEGCQLVCRSLHDRANIVTLEMTDCSLTDAGARHISQLIKSHDLARYSDSWMGTLRYREMDISELPGIRRVTVNQNRRIGDRGLQYIVDVVQDDFWLKAIDMQECNISEAGLEAVLDLVSKNTTLAVFDLRNNLIRDMEMLRTVVELLVRNTEDSGSYEFIWLEEITTTTITHISSSRGGPFSFGTASEYDLASDGGSMMSATIEEIEILIRNYNCLAKRMKGYPMEELERGRTKRSEVRSIGYESFVEEETMIPETPDRPESNDPDEEEPPSKAEIKPEEPVFASPLRSNSVPEVRDSGERLARCVSAFFGPEMGRNCRAYPEEQPQEKPAPQKPARDSGSKLARCVTAFFGPQMGNRCGRIHAEEEKDLKPNLARCVTAIFGPEMGRNCRTSPEKTSAFIDNITTRLGPRFTENCRSVKKTNGYFKFQVLEEPGGAEFSLNIFGGGGSPALRPPLRRMFRASE